MTHEEIDKIYRKGPTAYELGDFYSRHVMAMTAENLHSKSEIAIELGFRDARIKELLAAVKQLREEKADLTNRLTDAQDFINDRIEKGRR